MRPRTTSLAPLLLALAACASSDSRDETLGPAASERLARYATVRLTADLEGLTADERRLLPILIDAARAMDDAFWKQAWGDKEALLASAPDAAARRYCEINYGPWDRLDGNEPFLPGVGPKPAGAGFYPRDMTADEFEAHVAAHPADEAAFRSQYTVIRRDAQGGLVAVPYPAAFPLETRVAAAKLHQAASVAVDPDLKRYLEARALALATNEYRASDVAWLDMRENGVDVVIGPIETYEDQLFGYKAAHEAYVLIVDRAWSRRLARYAAFLPELQRGLPVPEEYRREEPGSDAQLNAYDVVYYAGDCNAGSKTIAINLPNDESVQLEKGTRRLQLKNAMRAKFDEILVPLADVLIAEDQRRHVTFDAFFENTMFHEVAHGLGIKNVLGSEETVRAALREHASTLEEGKADVLGLYMIESLRARGEVPSGELMDNYVTFLAGIFRSVRFGAASAHGRANMIRFNVFEELGAFERDEASGRYRVVPERMATAVEELSRRLLVLQGDGDHAGAGALVAERGEVGPALQADLDRLARAGIPVDVVFEQGPSVLGL